MNDDELRERLRRIDPVPDRVAVEPATTPSSLARMEHIMATDTTPIPSADPPSADRPTPDTGPTRPGRRLWLLGTAAAVAALVIGVAAVGLTGDDDPEPGAAGPALELSLGDGGVTASCLPLEVGLLAEMPVAFSATAAAVDDGVVTLDVDRWYTPGEAAVVELQAPPGQVALIAGFDFEVGQPYLITASEGTVNYCGYSGPATPELTALFDEAFAG